MKAGLGEVEIRAIEKRTVFKDFDDFWLPFWVVRDLLLDTSRALNPRASGFGERFARGVAYLQ